MVLTNHTETVVPSGQIFDTKQLQDMRACSEEKEYLITMMFEL